jgi:hypothetical protein
MNCSAGDLRSFNTRRINCGRAEQQRCHPEESAHCAPFALFSADEEGSAFRLDTAMAYRNKEGFPGAPSFALLGPALLAGRKTREGWEGVTL